MKSFLDRLLEWLFGHRTPAPQPTPVPLPPPGPVVAPSSEALDVVARTNQIRAGRGQVRQILDPALTAAAQAHSEEMARTGNLNHDNDGTPWDRMRVAGVEFTTAAENVAYALSVTSAVSLWLTSPPHLANILGPYSRTGVGVATDALGRKWWTQDFAGP